MRESSFSSLSYRGGVVDKAVSECGNKLYIGEVNDFVVSQGGGWRGWQRNSYSVSEKLEHLGVLSLVKEVSAQIGVKGARDAAICRKNSSQ